MEPAVLELTIVIPCYNEQEVLPETVHRIGAVLSGLVGRGKVAATSHICLVDDGSQDQTWVLIEQYAREQTFVRGIKLSRNRGHQNALLAGLTTATGGVVLSIDADLQDDVTAIEAMLDAHHAGADIVFGVRKLREADTFLKRFTAESYYRLLRLLGVDVVFNHADYRLMSRRAIEALREYSEVNLFLRGIIPQLGFRTATIYYDRSERFAGESKYPLRKMLSLAWNGVTSFSAAPLRLITGLGVLISLGSFGVALWALFVRFATDMAVPGWTSTVVPIYFIGGIQLLAMGIIGEYLAKIYMETKRRPRFVIERTV